MEYGAIELLPPGRERPWWRWLPPGLAVLSFLTSCVAFCFAPPPVKPWWATAIEAIYASAQLLILHMPHKELPEHGPLWPFHLARAIAVMAWASTAIVAVSFVFWRQLRRWWTVWRGGHAVICGLGGASLELTRQLAQHRVVVIDDQGNTAAEILAEESGASVLNGPADPYWLQRAGVEHARYVIAATEDDSANIAAIVRASAIPATGRKLLVHIADPQLRAELRRQRTFGSDATRATIFNVFDHSARLLLRDLPLDHVHIRPETEQTVQIVVIGFGLMGEAVLTRAALTGHYANLKRLEAIVIDRDADRKERLFRGRYPHFADVAHATFLKLDAQEPATQAQIAELCGNPARTISTIVIAFDDPARAFSIALSLADRVGARVPIRLRLDNDSGLGVLLQTHTGGGAPPGPIRAFGSLSDACNPREWSDSGLDVMARALHEDYLNKLPAAERARPENRSAYPWDRLDDDLVESNRQLADHIPVKLRAVGCHIAPKGDPRDPGALVQKFEDDDVELMAKMEHRRWMAERFLAGWTQGPKDVERRVSPYLVEWEHLTENIRDYDRNFVRILPGVLNLVNQEIRC